MHNTAKATDPLHLNLWHHPTSQANVSFKHLNNIPSLMGRNLDFSSIFFTAWPSCKQPRTDSFRFRSDDGIFKTVNSVYLDSTESWFTNSSSESETTASEEDGHNDYHAVEAVIRGLRSDRLFFEPGETSSILPAVEYLPFKESTAMAMAMESEDPYRDFRASMEEMVTVHGLKEWECLEKLLVCYLRVNGKKNHGFIFGAFIDLVLGMAGEDSPSSPASLLLSSGFYETGELKDEGDEESGSC